MVREKLGYFPEDVPDPLFINKIDINKISVINIMDFVKEFMTEQFQENKTYFIKTKVVWYRFKNSKQYIDSIHGKNKHDDFQYSTFINIMQKEYPKLYFKNHWKYGQCLSGGLKDKNGDLCDFIE